MRKTRLFIIALFFLAGMIAGVIFPRREYPGFLPIVLLIVTFCFLVMKKRK